MTLLERFKKLTTTKEKKPTSVIGMHYLFLKHCYFGTKMRVEFYRFMRVLTTNGVSIQSTLSFLSKEIELKNKKMRPLKKIVDDLIFSMNLGVGFEKAIAKWVPKQELALIESSRKDIVRAIEVVTQHAENMLVIKGAIVSALTYPVIMTVILLSVLVTFSFWVMPGMMQVSDPAHWPESAKNLLAFTDFLRFNCVIISVILIAFFTFMFWSLSNFSWLVMRIFLDFSPPWDIFKLYTSTSFLIALSSLIKTGASFHYAVLKIKENASPYLRAFLDRMSVKLSSGNNFGDAVNVGLFQGLLLIHLSVFSATNRLEQGVQFLADNNLEEQRLSFVRKGKVLGSALMVLSSVILGWIIMAMYGMQSSIATH